MRKLSKKARDRIRKSLSAYDIRDRRTNIGVVKRDYKFDAMQFSLAKFIRGGLYGNWSEASLEKREFIRLNKSTLQGASGPSGGFLVPEETTSAILEQLKAKAIIRALGATVYPMNGDTLHIRRQINSTNVHWVGSAEQATENTTTNLFSRDTLTLKKAIGLVPLDNDLLADASPSVDTIIEQDLVSELGLAEDIAAFEGDGNKEPLGLYNDPDITNTVLNDTVTTDDFIDMIDRIESANGRYTSWAMHPSLKNYVRKLKDANGNLIWTEGNISISEPPTLLGIPVAYSTQIDKTVDSAGVLDNSGSYTYAVLGSWPDLAIGQKAGQHIELASSDVAEDAFSQDETWIRAKLRVDYLAKYPACFQVLTAIHLS